MQKNLVNINKNWLPRPASFIDGIVAETVLLTTKPTQESVTVPSTEVSAHEPNMCGW
jgi:hypothetical protein